MRFDDWVELENINNERAALAFKNAIEDEVVLLQLTRLPEEIKKDYKKIRDHFSTTFDTNSDQFYKETLTENLKQKAIENVNEYYRRVYMNSNIKKEEKIMVTEFVRGLLPSIKYKILADTEAPKNMSQALRAAIKWEDILQEEKIHVNQINTSQDRDEGIKVRINDEKKIIEILERILISNGENFANIRTEMEDMQSQINNGQSQWKNEGNGENPQNFQQHGSPYNSNFRPKQNKECNYCGKMGHVQKQCFIRMNDEQTPTMSTDRDTKVRFRAPDYKVNSVLCDELNQ